jgi:hypothetical protein
MILLQNTGKSMMLKHHPLKRLKRKGCRFYIVPTVHNFRIQLKNGEGKSTSVTTGFSQTFGFKRATAKLKVNEAC